MRFSAFPLAASIASATPVLRGTYSSSNTAVPCGETGLQPLADCTVEHSSSALMPVNDFALILEGSAGSQLSTGTGKKAVHDFSGPLGSEKSTAEAGDLAWVGGTAYNFSMTYNASAQALAYAVEIAKAVLIGGVVLKALATGSGASMKIADLVVDGANRRDAQSFFRQGAMAGKLYNIGISGLNNSFNRSGKVTMAWPTEGTAPSAANTPAYMKFAVASGAPPPPPTVAEPAHFAMLGIGLAVPGAVHRSKRF